MAMAAAGTRGVVVGRTTAFSAMAAIFPSCHSPPSTSTSASAFSCTTKCSTALAPIPAMRMLSRRRTQHLRSPLSSWEIIPPRSFFTASIIACASSSSGTSAVDPFAVDPSSSSPAVVEEGGATATAAAEVDALDIKVGRVVKAWKHPEADSLYVEEVDLAEPEGPRTICSGLVNYLPLEDLQGRAVLVLANLKPRNMRGVKSNGMLLAASNADHSIVQLLIPPEGAAPGERVWFGDAADQSSQSQAGTPNQVQKKKIWETVQPLLKTDDDRVATFQSKPMRTSAGVVTSKSLPGASIS